MRASCHCGKVVVKLASRPQFVNFCDCSLCAKTGGAWAYYAPDEIQVSGRTTAYTRQDFERPAVVIHFCPDCGTTTHWRLVEGDHRNVSGVNIRLFSPDEVKGIEARFQDGRNWDSQSTPSFRRPTGVIGTDAFV